MMTPIALMRLNLVRLLTLLGLIIAALATEAQAQSVWVQQPAAASDIALADDGTAWMVGKDGAGPDYRLSRLSPGTSTWQALPGAAVRIAVNGDLPWVVNSRGVIYQFTDSSWRQVSGPKAIDIGASASGVWITAEPKQGNNYSIYQWTGGDWKIAPGSATRVDLDADGNPWIVNSDGLVYTFLENTWRRFDTNEPAVDVSVDAFGAPWMVGTSGALWHFGETTKAWESYGGKAATVAKKDDQLWQIDADKGLFRITLKDGKLPLSSPNLNVTRPSIPSTSQTLVLSSEQTLMIDVKPTRIDGKLQPSDSSFSDSVSISIESKLHTDNSSLSNVPTPTGMEIEVGGCMRDPSLCYTRAVMDPYPDLHGKLFCPVINAGPPARLQKSCNGIGAQAHKWGQADAGSSKCGRYMPASPGWGVPFHDPIYGGTCYSCPLGYSRTWARIDAPANALLQPCAAEFVWNLPQFPEPGVYAFLFRDASGDMSPLLDRAFGDPNRVDAYLNRRARGNSAEKAEILKVMIQSPGDSPEFKALVFAALIDILNDGSRGPDTHIVRRLETYIEGRRRYVTAEAQKIYEGWQAISAFEQSEAIKAAVRQGGGLPLTPVDSGAQLISSLVLGDSGSVSAKIFGSMPVDSLGYAWASAVPDRRGAEFIGALGDLVAMSARGELGAALPNSGKSFDPALLVQSLGAIVGLVSVAGDTGALIGDALKVGPFFKPFGKIKGTTHAATVLSIVSNMVQVVQAGLIIAAQDEAETAMKSAHVLANQPVNLYAAIGKESKRDGDVDLNQLLLYWALATSPYRGNTVLGTEAITDTCPPQTRPQCEKTRARMAIIASSALEKAIDEAAFLANNTENVMPANPANAVPVWVAGNGGALPPGAVVAGRHSSGTNLVVCRADMGDGIHPGKFWRGKCYVGWGGREIAKANFDVLTGGTNTLQWLTHRQGQALALNVIVAGKHEDGADLPVCRIEMRDGKHPGKVWGGKCNIGWGGKEIFKKDYEVLVLNGR